VVANPVTSISTGLKDLPRLPAGSVISSVETTSLDDIERKIAPLSVGGIIFGAVTARIFERSRRIAEWET